MHTYRLAEIKDGSGFASDARFEQVTDYNGWTNYETWAVALWINNGQGWQESVRESLRDASESGGAIYAAYDSETDREHAERLAAHEAGEIIRESVESDLAYSFGTHDGSMPASLAADLIGHAVARVDWTEIGASFLTDLAEQDES